MYFHELKVLKHALATPVTNILLNSELALASIKKHSRQEAAASWQKNFVYYFKQIIISAHYLKEITSQLDLQKSAIRSSFVQQTFLLKPAIEEVCALATQHLVNCQLINYLTLDNQLNIRGSKIYFQEALMCLLNNAFEAYTDSIPNKLVLIAARKQAQQVQINISDVGQGMHWLKQQIVMIPGVSSKAQHQGLGLAFAKKLITQQMAGKFKIYSQKNRGTRIELLLPVAK